MCVSEGVITADWMRANTLSLIHEQYMCLPCNMNVLCTVWVRVNKWLSSLWGEDWVNQLNQQESPLVTGGHQQHVPLHNWAINASKLQGQVKKKKHHTHSPNLWSKVVLWCGEGTGHIKGKQPTAVLLPPYFYPVDVFSSARDIQQGENNECKSDNTAGDIRMVGIIHQKDQPRNAPPAEEHRIHFYYIWKKIQCQTKSGSRYI